MNQKTHTMHHGKTVPLTAAVILSLFCLSVFSCIFISCGGGAGQKAEKPRGLGYHSMAYDSESGVYIIFGGQHTDYDMTSLTNTTWAYDQNSDSWKKMKPDARLPKIGAHSMAYDSESDRMVLLTGDTWTYDYNTDTWEKKNPAVRPNSVFGAKMAYDAESDRVIQFGGSFSNETWAYDTNRDEWTQMSPDIQPEARQYHAMTYDYREDRIVLFGGGKAAPGKQEYDEVFHDTWLYDFNSDAWRQSESESRPPDSVYHKLAYCENMQKTVLFGGMSYSAEEDSAIYIWTYDFKDDIWQRLDVPSYIINKRRMHEMAVIPGTASLMIVGGASGGRQEAKFGNDVKIVDLHELNR